jgi:hypothetical protein
MVLRKSVDNQFERRTYHVKVDILEEADNCTGIKEYKQCMDKNDHADFDYYSSIGCLPGWMFQHKLSYSKNASIWKLKNCKEAVENVSQVIKQNLMNDLKDYLNFRQTWRACTEPCKHTFYTSTLATKIANR